MNNTFTFNTESAVTVLNHISKVISDYQQHGEDLSQIGTKAAEEMMLHNAGRIAAWQDAHDFLTETFKGAGLEILELECENVEEETQTHVDVYGILGRAFSHFSK